MKTIDPPTTHLLLVLASRGTTKSRRQQIEDMLLTDCVSFRATAEGWNKVLQVSAFDYFGSWVPW